MKKIKNSQENKYFFTVFSRNSATKLNHATFVA
jgi:hypothetical protein